MPEAGSRWSYRRRHRCADIHSDPSQGSKRPGQRRKSASQQVQLARRQTEVQEQLYREQPQPYVWLDYRIDPISYWLVDLVIKNEGPTTARNVKFGIDPMIRRSKHFGDRVLAKLPGFLEGFAALPPGREMRWSLGSHADIFEQGALTGTTSPSRWTDHSGPLSHIAMCSTTTT